MTETKTAMTAGELTSHLQQTMRTNIGDHLREVHGLTEVPKTKQAQHKAHQKAHAEDVPATDAQTSKDASVLAGVTRRPEETKKVTPKPATRTRTPKAAPKPATKATGRKAPAKATPKPATKAAANGKADANGSVSPRETNQALAVRLVNLVAAEFGDLPVEDQTKIANWLKVLPTGGAAWQRYWPENFARPTTADWRKPE
jgi:cell division septation protein DedD